MNKLSRTDGKGWSSFGIGLETDSAFLQSNSMLRHGRALNAGSCERGASKDCESYLICMLLVSDQADWSEYKGSGCFKTERRFGLFHGCTRNLNLAHMFLKLLKPKL
jgi:hypothetical protein